MYFLMVPQHIPYTDNDYIMVRERTYKRLETAKKRLAKAPKYSYILDSSRRVVAYEAAI